MIRFLLTPAWLPALALALALVPLVAHAGHDDMPSDSNRNAPKKCMCTTDTAHLGIYLNSKCAGDPIRIDVGHKFELPSNAGRGCPEKDSSFTIYQRYKENNQCDSKTTIVIKCEKT